MTLAYTLTGVNLFIAFLLYRRARRLREEGDALKDYKASVARKVNETMQSFERTAVMHARQVEVLEAKVTEQERAIYALKQNKQSRTFVTYGSGPGNYWLN